jgi:hypothetical protein
MSQTSHERLKQQLLIAGKELGYSGSGQIKVLSTDPYFVGTDRDYEDAQWVADLWDRMMMKRRKPLHLRGFHYWVMSQRIKKPNGYLYGDGKGYFIPKKIKNEVIKDSNGKTVMIEAPADPMKDWQYILGACQVARYLGIGKWENLVDLKHPEPNDYDNYFVGSGLERDGDVNVQEEIESKISGLVEDVIKDLLWNIPKYRTDGYQMYHLEVWCEKNSMGFVIDPACRHYGATYQPLVGQASVEKVNMSAERAIKAAKAGKKVRIFYIADYDRYGWSMVSAVARKLEFFVRDFPSADIRLTRLALNEEQINKFNLPKAPKHGEEVVELDALEAIYPGELGKIVEHALLPYYDSEKPKIVDEENKRIKARANELIDQALRTRLEEQFAKIDVEGLSEGIDLQSLKDESFEEPEPEHEVNERKDWVYDSTRDYFEQLREYKKYKASREEEGTSSD